MRHALFLLALPVAVAACGGGSGDDGVTTPPTGPITASVTHYGYTLDLDSRAAHAVVSATVTTAGDCIALPFRGASLSAKSVLLNGVAAKTAAVANDTLTACGTGYDVATPLVIEANLTIALATLAPSQVGYSTEQDAQHNFYYYLVSWVGGCDQFAPCDNRADQFATYTFAITHKAGFTVRCPGAIDESDPAVTKCDFEYAGGPTYSTFGLIASNAWLPPVDEGSWGGVHVTLYDRSATAITAAVDPAYHGGFLTWMESQFGPYPYGGDLRILTAPTYWNGFEHPGNIVLADTLKHQINPGYANNVAHTLDHEMTHMWAGNQTTIAGTYDFAWKESMAEYLPFVYEDMTGSDAVSSRSSGTWKSDATAVQYYPVPDDMPALIDFYSDVYGAGPMIFFRQVEVMFGRDKVLAALKTLLGTPHAISVDDVIAALSTATGTDLTAYGKAWLHGTGTPEWPQFTTTYTAGSLAVHQTNQAAGVRGCAFHVELLGSGAGETRSVAVDTFRNGADQTLTVTAPAFDVVGTKLDPDNECLVYPTPVPAGSAAAAAAAVIIERPHRPL